jgi:hypothetical protein
MSRVDGMAGCVDAGCGVSMEMSKWPLRAVPTQLTFNQEDNIDYELGE